jgi:uncharacterized protein YmfQ (DUF2313 family)
VALTAEQYRDQLIALLPQGAAWIAEPITVLYKLLHGVAESAARVDTRVDDLIREINPETTSELLADWERALGLPDNCGTAPTTAVDRRDAVVLKLNTIGGQSPKYFIDLAALYGYTITITEFRPFKAGSKAGTPLYGKQWAYWFQVNGYTNTIKHFKAGLSKAGEPLRSWGNDVLECLINKYKPAHTDVIFAYTVNPSEAGLLDFSNPDNSQFLPLI